MKKYAEEVIYFLHESLCFQYLCSVFSFPLILKVVTWYEIIFTELCHDLRVETVLFTKTFS